MRKFILSVLLSQMLAITALGVPALRKTFTFAQSDGSSITLTYVGDEWLSGYVTSDGLAVDRAANGDFYYRTLGGLTSVMAHDVSQRQAAEQAYVASNRDNLKLSAQAGDTYISGRRQSARAPRRAGTVQVPTTGTPRVPILLVQFSDKRMSNNKASFQSHYTTGNKSAYQYFYDQSYGQYQPQFDVYGIYTLPSTRATYGAHGVLNDREVKDVGVAQMVIDGITQAGDDVDWSQYDNDGDGEVDVCIVVYAGVGEAQAYGVVPNAVWPCQWNLYSGWYYGDGTGPVERNEVVINRFAVFNEVSGSNDYGSTLDGVGTFCHEFSHCLGLPDFYETTYENDYYGMGTWSIMCSGCYNGEPSGYTPCGYTAYERNFMGWKELTEPEENTKYTLGDIADENSQALIITNPSNGNEYYILENRQKSGWNQYMQSSGLMVTHVTYSAQAWTSNTVNNYMPQRMTIIPADNKLSVYNEYGDLYPYNGNNKLTDTSTPAATLNLGQSLMGKPITEITKSGSNITLWFERGMFTKEIPVLNEVEDSTITTSSFAITWNSVQHVDHYALKMTNTATGASFVKNNITDTEATVDSGLEEGSTYNVQVSVYYTDGTQSAWSDAVTVTLKENLELYPVQESTVTETGFTATWKAMKQGNNFDLQVVQAGMPLAQLRMSESFERFTTTSTTNIASSLDNYMDNAGWTGSYLYSYTGGLRMGGPNTQVSSLKSPAMDMSDSDGQMTIRGKAYAYYASAGDCNLTIIVNGVQYVVTVPAGEEAEFAVLAACPTTNAVKVGFTMTKGHPLVIERLEFYSGDGTVTTPRQVPSITGDATSQIISGIEGTSYDVTGLTKGKTYYYRVRMNRYDGTSTMWSDLQSVKLKGVSVILGDVNDDGRVDVQDVSATIDYILNQETGVFNVEAADVNGDGNIDVQDVSGIIDIILNS